MTPDAPAPARTARVSSLRGIVPSLALAGVLLAGCGGGDITNPSDCEVGDLVQPAVGELRAISPDSDGCLSVQLAGGSGPAEYVVMAQETSRSTGFTSLGLRVEGGSGASGALAPAAAPQLSVGGAVASARSRIRGGEMAGRIRENALRELERRSARPAARASYSARPGVSRNSLLPSDSEPDRGDTLDVRLTVQSDLSVSCSIDSSTVVTSRVQAVGDEVALLADTAIADDAVSQIDWSGLAGEYDRSVLGVPEAYFGQATDIDGNQHVLVLFTPEVNKLTEKGSDVRIGGFFIPADLADSGDGSKGGSDTDGTCPASNEAEIVYLLAPDPTAEFSDSVSVEAALRTGIGASPGEFEHLINTGNRLIKQGGSFSQLESTWLDEGLSHIAEEAVGLKRAGLPVRDNLDLSQAAADSQKVAAFNNFHLQNFLRLRRFLINPDSTRALASEDPQGTESLEMRGFSYLFLRWLGDHYGPSGTGAVDGSNEQELFRMLARGSGSLATGITNVETAVQQVTGSEVSWNELIRDFAAVPAADDTVPNTSARLQLRTWNLPLVFRQLSENEGTGSAFPEVYPLELTDLGSPQRTTVSMEVRGSTARYFRVSAPSGNDLTVRLTGPGNTLLGSSSSRLLVLRAQ